MAQLGVGSITALVFVFAGVFFTGAAFRPVHDPELTRMLNDLGWMTLLMTLSPFIVHRSSFIVQNLTIGFFILSDKRDDPVFPRWVGYFNLRAAVLIIPGGLLTFFKTGPFAWDELPVWWIPFVVFFSWCVLMIVVLLGVVKKQARTE